jgi:superfamily II DNA or RNA helicase
MSSSGFPSCAVKVEPGNDHFRPYEHQRAAWNALDKHFLEKSKPAGILVVPTGGGKTAIASRWPWLLPQQVAGGGRILWLTHRRSLLIQAFNAFLGAAHLAVPKEDLRLISVSGQDRSWSNVSARDDIVFSTVQSAARQQGIDALRVMLDQSPKGLFVVVDEAHHAAAPSYRRVLDLLQRAGCFTLGLSATPVRMDPDDERRLWQTFGQIIYQISKKRLIEIGVLSSPHIETVETHVEFEREFTQTDFDHLSRFGELAPAVLDKIANHSGRNHLIAEYYAKNRAKFGKTIVFAVDILHARTLTHEFSKNGIDVDYVDHTRADSSSVMDAYRDGEKPQVLVNVEMLTEGYDAPRTQTIFLARPTQSEALLSQMVGRGLRGPQAGGTRSAYLVTFVDTWRQFHPLEAEYVVLEGEVDDADPKKRIPAKILPIAPELIMEAYKLVRSNVRGDFRGIFQCLPHSWYVWEEEFDDEIRKHSIMIFENQVEGFQRLETDFRDPSSIPAQISESYGRELLRRYFGECQDPLPRWFEIRSLLEARRRSTPVGACTLEEKEVFDPARLAKEIRENDLGEQAKETKLRSLFEENPVCRMVYRDDIHSFFEDVDRELSSLRERGRTPVTQILEMVPTDPPRRWPENHAGHELGTIWDSVVGQQKHFPKGAPLVRDLSFSSKPLRSHWGWFRYSDKAICVNCVLNSPDVPVFVLEFLIYHEALHADMPNAGHNRDFRERERRFVPSSPAVEEAGQRGFAVRHTSEAWYALADQFLDTFEQRFAPSHGRRGMLL